MQLHHGSAQLSAACPLLRGSARSTRHASPAPHSGRHGRRGARPRAFRPVRAAAGGGGSGDARASLYPAGQRQARLRLPALLLFVTADALLDEEAVREELAAAVSAGATAVVLAEGADAGGGAARLYDAALALKELLRSRAALMIRDRTDIAAQLSQLLSASREALVEAERGLLTDLLGFLSEACPELEEAVLVQDALRQLDELFLLVVVGEFNSGKSAVVNALLGQRYLAEGILPTTNEICVLKWGETDEASYSDAGGVQDSEGVFTRKLPAELLREVNVVDTPGTNVILERQQRLTEEYVPRADLVLFVLSADRPFTDSEVRFLKYVRQWGKKVVFVVNKVDLLSSEAEVDEVVGFVRENAGRLLDVRDARVLPISARAAMEAKLACRGVAASERPRFWPAGADGDSTDSDLEPLHASTSTSGGVLTPEQAAVLAADPNWQRSRFESLEHFIYQFLVRGSPGTAVASLNFSSDDEEIGAEAGSGAPLATGESVRLKLQTPLFMAEALIDQAGRAVGAELEAARENLGNLRLVRTQLMHFKKEMGKEGRLQREEVSKLVKAGVQRNGRAVDATLKLSNWEVLLNYLLNGSKDGGAGPAAHGAAAGGGGAGGGAQHGGHRRRRRTLWPGADVGAADDAGGPAGAGPGGHGGLHVGAQPAAASRRGQTQAGGAGRQLCRGHPGQDGGGAGRSAGRLRVRGPGPDRATGEAWCRRGGARRRPRGAPAPAVPALGHSQAAGGQRGVSLLPAAAPGTGPGAAIRLATSCWCQAVHSAPHLPLTPFPYPHIFRSYTIACWFVAVVLLN